MSAHSQIKTPIRVQGGWLDSHFIRRARKEFTCDYWLGLSSGGFCRAPVAAGDLYVEGEPHPDVAGGWGCHRYCLNCAGDEARASLPLEAA